MLIKKGIGCFMKNILFLLIIVGFTCFFESNSSAQTKKTEPNAALVAADKYFNNFEYYLAAEKYAKVLKTDSSNAYALYQLAESYRYYNNYKGAEIYYQKVTTKFKSAYPLAHYWYASSLKDNGNYSKAIYHFEKFRNETVNTNLEIELYREKALQEIKGCYITLEEFSKTKKDFGFKCLPSPINSNESEYSPVITKNDSALFITTSRKGTAGKQKNSSLGGSSSDVYRFLKKDEKNWEEIKIESDDFPKLNTPFNECSGSFTKDEKKYYFTRCDVVIKTDNYEDITCAIYVSHYKNGIWESPIKLNNHINAPGQWNSQPSISPDGTILFFVSKRPGGIGMHDIWYSTSNGDDRWGPAINLGDKINTLFMDVSPRYYADQKVLFFASNGHGGHGGLDIFMTKEDESFENIINLGYPFNTNRDDFYFVLGDKKGYITSNRQGGNGSDDIYSFDINGKKNLISFIEDSMVTAPEPPSLIPISTETSKPITNKAIIAAIDNSSKPTNKSITVDGKILSEDDRKPVADLTILLVDESGSTLKSTKTDKRGYYKFSNLDGKQKYNLIFQQNNIADDKKYLSENVNIKGSDSSASKQFFENIFFDFDSYVLRPEAKKVLDELIALYQKDSLIQLELYANTDSYGTSEYNKNLAANRGKVAMEYLMENGLPQSSMVVNSVGENKSIATNDTELGRQLNRRVEFYLLGASAVKYENVTYIIESKKTVYALAKEYNMTEEELIELNGLTGKELVPYTPVRLKKQTISTHEMGAPTTHILTSPTDKEKKYSKEEEAAIIKNQAVNKNFNFRNPEYLKYLDSIATAEKGIHPINENVDYYTVQPKNTLSGIASLYGINPEKLRLLNKLTSDSIHTGQRIKIDFRLKDQNLKGYLVKEGETAEQIAKRFEMPVKQLYDNNKLTGYLLKRNMVLRLTKE